MWSRTAFPACVGAGLRFHHYFCGPFFVGCPFGSRRAYLMKCLCAEVDWSSLVACLVGFHNLLPTGKYTTWLSLLLRHRNGIGVGRMVCRALCCLCGCLGGAICYYVQRGQRRPLHLSNFANVSWGCWCSACFAECPCCSRHWLRRWSRVGFPGYSTIWGNGRLPELAAKLYPHFEQICWLLLWSAVDG